MPRLDLFRQAGSPHSICRARTVAVLAGAGRGSALLGVFLMVAVLGVWLLPGYRPVHAATPAVSAAVPISAEQAKQQDVPVFLRGLGAVRAFYTVEIKAQVSGTLLAIPVREGQEVHQGDVVARIDPRPYQATLDQARAQRAEDAAQLRGAQLDLQRYQDLAKRDFAPRQQVDDQQAAVDKLLATLQADDAAIETAAINLDFCTIRTPINGRVGFYDTDPGNLIEVAGQTGILSIAQDRPIAVVFSLPEERLLPLQQTMAKAALPVLAYASDDTTRLADGVLTTPNNAIDTTTGTIQLKATFPNDDERLWPGEFVNARVLVDTLRQVITVPFAAIQHGPEGLYVYVVNPDNTVSVQAVQIGYEDDAVAVVASGLHAGQNVVLTGQSRLAAGMRVIVTPDRTGARLEGAGPPRNGTAP